MNYPSLYLQTLLLLFTTFHCLSAAAIDVCEKPLSISFDTNAEPWSFLNQNGQLTGLDVELVMGAALF